MALTPELLTSLGVPEEDASRLAAAAAAALSRPSPEARWRALVRDVLRPDLPHEVHVELHRRAFDGWDPRRGPVPAWLPEPDEVARTNAAALARAIGLDGPADLHGWSAAHRDEFWRRMVERLEVRFQEPPAGVVDLAAGEESPRWLPGARMNIVETCLGGDPDRLAIRWRAEDGTGGRLTVGELQRLTNRVAHGLRAAGFVPGDAIAIDMPMTAESVAIYLGIIASGGVAVSVADSFAAGEIATRLRLAGARGIFTQDVILRGGKRLPLYEKVREAAAPRAVVLPAEGPLQVELRGGDVAWESFLGGDLPFAAVARAPDDPTNVLFSSGTTGDPKAIPWTQTTPIKAATDGHLHHDIRPGDVVAWPTNLGWMMGPWLIYASLCNRASMALYYGAPAGAGFAGFVQDAGVTMLGVVPSLVKTWRESGCLTGVDWRGLRAFSSTGECSNPATTSGSWAAPATGRSWSTAAAPRSAAATSAAPCSSRPRRRPSRRRPSASTSCDPRRGSAADGHRRAVPHTAVDRPARPACSTPPTTTSTTRACRAGRGARCCGATATSSSASPAATTGVTAGSTTP